MSFVWGTHFIPSWSGKKHNVHCVVVAVASLWSVVHTGFCFCMPSFCLTKPWFVNYTLSVYPFADRGTNTVSSMVTRGVRPGIPADIRNSEDPIIQALVKAIDMCLKQDPADRASAEEVRDMLRRTGQQSENKALNYITGGVKPQQDGN